MQGIKSIKVLPGHEKDFEEEAMAAHKIAKGTLGWRGQAEMMVMLGLDKDIFKGKTGKRKRVKRMKKFLKEMYLREVFQHCEVTFEDGTKHIPKAM